MFLDGILKGLVLWIYGLILEGVEYMADSLLNIFSLDLAYFETYAPVVNDIQNIVIAVGWALLIGNLVFQAMRSMAAGLGFEGEDPVALGTRTFVFAFLLMASRQICAIGLNFTSAIMDLFQVPDAVEIITPDENAFGIDSSWLLAMIVGLILIFQVIKFFFEIGERYVITVILVVLAPLAFGMGGSKNTEDIFKGWCRMFGSMCVMMLMNVIFLKLLLSTMSTVPSGLGIFPWLIFVTAIVRVGRKIDDIVCRMGLNPAHTGSPLGHGFMALPTMMANHAARTVIQTVAANRTGGGKTPSSGNRNTNRPSSGSAAPGPNPTPSSPPPAGGGTGSTAPGKAAASTGGTPPAGTTPKAPNPGSAPAPAAANPGTAQGQPGAPAPAKNTSQEGATPTRPPLGRGRVFTPPSAGGTPGQQGGKDNTPTPSHPTAAETPGQPGTPGHPTSQAPAAATQQNSGINGQEKAPTLSANTPVPHGTVTAKDGKNAGTPQSPGNPSRPAPAAKPPAGTSSRPTASGSSQTNSSTTSQMQNGPRTHTPAAGVPGAPGTPGHPAAPGSNRPERSAPKPAGTETSSPSPQNPAAAPSGIPVRNPGAVSGGTTQHGPSRAPTGVSNSGPSGTTHTNNTGTRPPQSNPLAAAPAPATPKGPGSTPPSRPNTPPRPATPAAPAAPVNPVQGKPKQESSQRLVAPSDRPSKNPLPVQEDKKSENGSTRPARPGEPQK